MIEAIISGFQTGADIGGIKSAIELGLGTGGYMPKGWETERGSKPEYEELYGAVETESRNYPIRTKMNAELADATVIFGRRSVGSNKTEEYCRLAGNPYIWIWWPEGGQSITPAKLRLWLIRYKVKILNCSGNRESKNPGIEEFTKSFIIKALGGKNAI